MYNMLFLKSNQTALMLAVKHEKADLVELLLENGAAVNLQDTDGSTALMCAVERGSLNIVKLLLTRSECDVHITDNVTIFYILFRNLSSKLNCLCLGRSNSCHYCNK